MPPKKASKSTTKTAKKTSIKKASVKKASVKKAVPISEKKEVPLHSNKDDAQEVAEIKRRRDILIAKDPDNAKWIKKVHESCMGLYRCYREGDRPKCLKDIHDKLDKLEKK